MHKLPTNVGGFIKVAHLLDLEHGQQPCIAMVLGLRPINFVQFKANSIKGVQKALRSIVPVVVSAKQAEAYGEESIPVTDGQLHLTDFNIVVNKSGHYIVQAGLTAPARFDTQKDLAFLKGADPDNYVIIVPRLLTTALKSSVGQVNYVNDIGGAYLSTEIMHTRAELGEAGYGEALKDYDSFHGET